MPDRIAIDSIRIGERHRRDLGDLAALAASVREVGLLQPIGVTAAGELVFGHRRLLACRDHLGWTEIPARVVDVPSIVHGEYHENELRKDFAPSERVAIAEAVRAAIGDRHGERTDLRRPDGGGGGELPGHDPEVGPGEETRDAAARLAGFASEKTYRRAKEVVEKAAPNVVEAMDRGAVSIRAAAEAIRAEPDPAKQAGWTPADTKAAAKARLAEELRGKTRDEVFGDPAAIGATLNAAAEVVDDFADESPSVVARRLIDEILGPAPSPAAGPSRTVARDPDLDTAVQFLARVTPVLHRREPWPFAAVAAATPDHVVAMHLDDLREVARLVAAYIAALEAREGR